MREGIVPLFDLAVLSFAFHFVWEFAQVPWYLGMPEIGHWDGVRQCARAAIGDTLIAACAFAVAAFVAGNWHWHVAASRRAIGAFFSVGLALTVVVEFASTTVLDRWSYAPSMPRIPLLGTGLAPFLQWIAIPALVLHYLRRLHPRDNI